MSKLCWICNQRSADSGEHKIKASLLKRWFGDNYNDEPMYFGQGSVIENIYSPKSKHLKFPKVICQSCNGKFTQTHDRSYDLFNEYLNNNYEKLFSDRTIDFRDMYEQEWSLNKVNLYKYFAKHVGCKVATSGMSHYIVGLSEFIRGLKSAKSLIITFELNEGMKEAFEAFRKFELEAPYIGNIETIWFDDDLGNRFFAGKIVYQWMSVVWIQGERISSIADFSKPVEPLSIKLFNQCDSLADCKNGLEAYHRILYSGMTPIENSREYYLQLLAGRSTSLI